MSAIVRTEKSFNCPVCLDPFTDPVTTPCGHNFCKTCLSRFWDTEDSCSCPVCKHVFLNRPELKINTLIKALMGSHQTQETPELPPKLPPKPGTVLCDYCFKPQQKAVKSCLICTASYCETHLQLHLTSPALKTHQLTLPTPLNDTQDRMCQTHQRPLELFCNTEQVCVCSMCALEKHNNHYPVYLEVACEQKKASLQSTQGQIQLLVEQRRLKVQEIQHSLELSRQEAQRETAQMIQVFTDIKDCVQKCMTDNCQVIEQDQSAIKKNAQSLIAELKEEIGELEKSSEEVQQLSHAPDPLRFLQNFCEILPPAGLKDWSRVKFEPQACEGSVQRALSELQHALSKKFNPVLKRTSTTPELSTSKTATLPKFKMPESSIAKTPKCSTTKVPVLSTPNMADLSNLKRYAVNITLDAATAHSELVVSKDNKRVYHSDMHQLPRVSVHKFTCTANVLGKQSFSSGRVYYEVLVEGKTEYDLGVAHQSIKRKGPITASPKHGQWSICLRDSTIYNACTDPWTLLSLQRPPQKIGVFIDYEAGLISFYDADSGHRIFSFANCRFSDKLRPLFSPGNNHNDKNSIPLIITPVHQIRSSKGESL